MNSISFMTANFMARQLDYNMSGDWSQGDNASNAFFEPLETYAKRFGAMLDEIVELGFDTIDLWGAHLNPNWATVDHIEMAKEALVDRNLRVASFAGWWDDMDYLRKTVDICVALDIPVLGGGGSLVERDHNGVADLMREYNLVYGLENHPEKTPNEILAKIGTNDLADAIGVAMDTGWFGTYGFDAPTATTILAPRLVHVHLKDVLEAGSHKTCRYGEGVVEIQRTVEALLSSGYTGGISIEHEPEDHDPRSEVAECLQMLRSWL